MSETQGFNAETEQPKYPAELAAIVDKQANIESINYDEFIDKRLSELNEKSVKTHLDAMSKPYAEFIHPETEITPNLMMGGSYKLDDEQPYKIFVDRIKQYRNFEKLPQTENDPTGYFNMAIREAFYGQAVYFKGFGSSSERQRMIMDAGVLQPNEDGTESERVMSIKEFADKAEETGKAVAACTERAAVTHNLLKFAGIKSTLVAGKLETESQGQKTQEMHSFQVLEPKQGVHILLDVTNPVVYQSHDGKRQFGPAFYSLDDEAHSLLMTGEPVSFETHTRILKEDGSAELGESHVRTYSINKSGVLN